MILTSIMILSVVGFSISLYTYYVERKIRNEPAFKPVCDINDQISCTKPMRSKYANIFYFSNALVGMLYYVLIGALAFLTLPQLLLIVTIGGCIISAVLAYLLYFKIKSLCILCTSLYIINSILLLLALQVQ